MKRDGRTLDLTLTPFYDAQAGRYRVGFSFGQERVRVSVFESIPFSLQYNVESVRLILSTLKNLVFKGQGVDDVTGRSVRFTSFRRSRSRAASRSIWSCWR